VEQRRKFTGWMDIDLSEEGKEEARIAGRLLNERDANSI